MHLQGPPALEPGISVDLSDTRIWYRRFGTGPRLVVLLHGWPETSLCWRHVLPALGPEFTVIAPDLRGYGESGLASTGYSKRANSGDLHELIAHLGWSSAYVAGHDRGARVAHRWALDYPEDVERLALMDILPMREMLTGTNLLGGRALWHWLFHLAPELPETLVVGNERVYLRHFLGPPVNSGAIDEATFEEYVRAYSDPAKLAASFDDYRASFGEDLEADERDVEAGRLLEMPLLVMWGAAGALASGDPLGVWRRYGSDVRGTAVSDSGHFIPEEQPALVARELRDFFLENPA